MAALMGPRELLMSGVCAGRGDREGDRVVQQEGDRVVQQEGDRVVRIYSSVSLAQWGRREKKRVSKHHDR